jgi:hypothetical protein
MSATPDGTQRMVNWDAVTAARKDARGRRQTLSMLLLSNDRHRR